MNPDPTQQPVGIVTSDDPFHLFIYFGPGLTSRTHLGGFPYLTAAISAQMDLDPRAAVMFPDYNYEFRILNGPVTLLPQEQQYGGPWDKL